MTKENVKLNRNKRSIIANGAAILSNAVGVTLGPAGSNVLVERELGPPQVTNDGSVIASQIEFSNNYESIGARLLREVARETGSVARDGTTTAVLLANSIFSEGLRAVEAGLDPIGIKRGIDMAVSKSLKHISASAQPVNKNSQVTEIAITASNNDSKIGKAIAKAYSKTGEFGEIFVKSGNSVKDQIEINNGMWFDRGYISRAFVTNESDLSAELRNPLILLYGKKIKTLEGFIPFLDAAIEKKRPLLIIAEDIEQEVLATLVINREKGGLKVVAVKSPGFSERRREMLDDIAIITGAKVISGEPGLDLMNSSPDQMGTAGTVRITASKTIIIEGGGSLKNINNRCKLLSNYLEKSDSIEEREFFSRRIAKLKSSIVNINVGGFTEQEITERTERYNKALMAVAQAKTKGFVVGGGVIYLRASSLLGSLKGEDCEEQIGINIVRRALLKPCCQILENAGADISQSMNFISSHSNHNLGMDVRSLSYVDMIEKGIIDSAGVLSTALSKASSIAGSLITSMAIVPEKKIKTFPRHPFACKCSDHDHHHYPGDPYHAHHHAHPNTPTHNH
ncbi:MAG: molecular chaperone GroEL [Alphaproteobacteria bacterium]|nr:molecular chaperone GroEL [Alphaproteobacteria bacterium]